MKLAIKRIIKLVEDWCDNPKKDHVETLNKILETALDAMKGGKDK